MRLFFTGFIVGGLLFVIPCYRWAYEFSPPKVRKKEQKAFSAGVISGTSISIDLLKSGDFPKIDFIGAVYRKAYDSNPYYDPR